MHDIASRVISAIRVLSADAIERANSGHPGLPLGIAPLGFILFDRYMKYNPENPRWFNRDRFVLSAGHGSMLLYSLLYLYGFPLSIEEIKRFRQLGSKTPGHPEYDPDIGVETTTGPLGQGFANAVGMAIAYKYMSAYFNREINIVDHRIFVIASDGDLMEGISYEASSLAGHLKLSNLIVFWDNNGITIEGSTSLAWSEDVLKRFESQGWYVDQVEDVNDLEQLIKVIDRALLETRKPKFIAVRSIIGYGTKNKKGTAEVHGAPLGKEELEYLRNFLGWEYEPFYIPKDILTYTRRKVEEGRKLENQWKALLQEYARKYPELHREFMDFLEGKVVDTEVFRELPRFSGKAMATRSALGKILTKVWKPNRFILGGSADLGTSNKTYIKELGDFSHENPLGRNLHFGVREHAMGAIVNGIALYGMKPFGATFLVFSDYMRTPIRLSALMKLPVIFIFTHDSIGLGEDGPTHQPVEHLPSLRAIPNLVVIRPADANETIYALKYAFERKEGPTALILTRQNVPILDEVRPEMLYKGAYVLKEHPESDVVIYASGSEVHIALETSRMLEDEGFKVDVINVVSWEIFDMQERKYKDYILNRNALKVYIEASYPLGWERFVGSDGLKFGITTFGESAPYKDIYEHFGLTPENVKREIVYNLVNVRKHNKNV